MITLNYYLECRNHMLIVLYVCLDTVWNHVLCILYCVFLLDLLQGPSCAISDVNPSSDMQSFACLEQPQHSISASNQGIMYELRTYMCIL